MEWPPRVMAIAFLMMVFFWHVRIRIGRWSLFESVHNIPKVHGTKTIFILNFQRLNFSPWNLSMTLVPSLLRYAIFRSKNGFVCSKLASHTLMFLNESSFFQIALETLNCIPLDLKWLLLSVKCVSNTQTCSFWAQMSSLSLKYHVQHLNPSKHSSYIQIHPFAL